MSLLGKMSVQEKMAELERRIAALEAKRPPTDAYSRVTMRKTTTTTTVPDLEPEMGGLWKSFDALMQKAFGK